MPILGPVAHIQCMEYGFRKTGAKIYRFYKQLASQYYRASCVPRVHTVQRIMPEQGTILGVERIDTSLEGSNVEDAVGNQGLERRCHWVTPENRASLRIQSIEESIATSIKYAVCHGER